MKMAVDITDHEQMPQMADGCKPYQPLPGPES
jgi:hypothetical protein